jgi:hypothetical protein
MSSIHEKEVINLVMRQTDYTEEQSKEKLKQWNNNYINVIKEYLNPEFNKKEIKKTTKTLNQQMMGEIRSFMDDVYIKFENRKKYNQYANIIKQMREKELSKKKEDSNIESEEVVNKIKIEEVE